MAISRLRVTMRVLILSAFLACAAAAPSAPVLAIAPIIPAAIPTLSPGDLQGAAIDAKVQVEDQARAIADQAKLAADVAREQAEALGGQKIIAYAAPSAPVLAGPIADQARLAANWALGGQKIIAYAAPSAPALAIAPTPGDLQAAAIDAKVQAEDQARAIADQARLAANWALEGQKIIAYAAPSASVLAIAPTPGDLQAAAIDAKVQAEGQARAIADQARLATNWALEGQKIIAYAVPSAPLLAIAPPSGDLQAAAIDAKVQAEDQARAIADEARLAADQARLAADMARDQAELAMEGQKEKSEEVTTIVKEKNEDVFWNVEDKKWQAIDAVKTVEAKLDGAVASNAAAIAKSLIYPGVSPIIPYPNLVYPGYPGLVPIVKEGLVKTGDKEELKKVELAKLEIPKLEWLAAPGIGLVGAPWPVGAPVVYQPGLLGAPVVQQVITQQWK